MFILLSMQTFKFGIFDFTGGKYTFSLAGGFLTILCYGGDASRVCLRCSSQPGRLSSTGPSACCTSGTPNNDREDSDTWECVVCMCVHVLNALQGHVCNFVLYEGLACKFSFKFLQ
ncbi:hypothetical protein BS78_07G069100 [Paspalum vaginatum]|nr:hypothetical protein BS78_07G069100 [Paspalum vaginatum]